MRDSDSERETLALNEAASHLLEECRMVLPGIQALFGFQLVAVFNNRFNEALTPGEQILHYVATVLVALAVAVVMGPAAWHRQVEPQSVSTSLIRVSSKMLLWSMPPLAVAISLEIFLIGRVILQSRPLAITIALLSFSAFGLFWVVVPAYGRRERAKLHEGESDG